MSVTLPNCRLRSWAFTAICSAVADLVPYTYAFTDDATVFFADGCDITAGTASDIREDDNKDKDPYKQVVFHTDDGDIDVIVLVKD